MLAASPTKLRSGDWGARVQTDGVALGDIVEITTRSGKSWTATVDKVVWKGNGVAIVSTSSTSAKAPRRSRVTRTGCSCGSVEEFEKPGDCWQCRHDR